MDLSLYLKYDNVFVTKYPNGYSFTWRLLNQKEYRLIASLRAAGILTEGAAALAAFKLGYIGDYLLINRKIPAGLINNVGAIILYLSGDCDGERLKTDIEMARNLYNRSSVIEHMKAVIYTAFPLYTPEDLDLLTRPQLLAKFALAEDLLLKRGLLTPESMLNTDKIVSGDQETPEQETGDDFDFKAIDIDKENQEYQKALGVIALEEAESLYVEQKKSKPKLSPEIARRLDRR